MNQNFAEFDPFKITPILEWLQPPPYGKYIFFYWSLHFWQKNAMHRVLIQSTLNQHKPLIRFTFETKKKLSERNLYFEHSFYLSFWWWWCRCLLCCLSLQQYVSVWRIFVQYSWWSLFFYSFLGCEEEFTTLAEKSLFTLHRFDVQMCV